MPASSTGCLSLTVLATRPPSFEYGRPIEHELDVPSDAPSVLVLGDSLATAIGLGFQRWGEKTGRARVDVWGFPGCSLLERGERALANREALGVHAVPAKRGRGYRLEGPGAHVQRERGGGDARGG